MCCTSLLSRVATEEFTLWREYCLLMSFQKILTEKKIFKKDLDRQIRLKLFLQTFDLVVEDSPDDC